MLDNLYRMLYPVRHSGKEEQEQEREGSEYCLWYHIRHMGGDPHRNGGLVLFEYNSALLSM
jgi:hypothetical protein